MSSWLDCLPEYGLLRLAFKMSSEFESGNRIQPISAPSELTTPARMRKNSEY